MKIAINYKHAHVESHEDVEMEASKCIEKIKKLLKAYDPDLVQLHGVFSKTDHDHEEFSFSLNLSLPTGSLHATGAGKNGRACCKQAFKELETQLKKHQALLRKDYEWKRKRTGARPRVAASLS